MPRVFHIRPSNNGQTLASALRRCLGPEVPWSEVKRLIARRYITVNGNLCVDEGRRVRTDDVVHVFEQPRPPLPDEEDIRLVYLDADVVVIDKPAGLTTLRHHEETDLPRRRKDKAPTLDELLERKLLRLYHASGGRQLTPRASPMPPGRTPRARVSRPPPPPHPLRSPVPRVDPAAARPASDDVGRAPSTARPLTHPELLAALRKLPQPPRLRPVHRLDRDTSGLMLFALSPAAETALERDFARHAVDRRYLAVVHGHLADSRTLETWIVRDRGDGRRGSSPLGKDSEAAGGQRAVTHIAPVETLGPCTVVECRLETGRTHQIRIHLSELGHVLVGEKLYRPAPPPPDEPSRHLLHAYRLTFTHPTTGQLLAFQSPLPADMTRFLQRLRRRADGHTGDPDGTTA